MQKSATAPVTIGSGLNARALTPYALWTLLAAGLGELFLYRMLSRVGVHIPKQGAVLDVYDALVQAGSFAFDVSSVVVFAALALLVAEASRRRARSALAAAAPALALAFAAVSLLLAFVDEGESAKLAYGLLSATLMVTLAALVLADGEAAGPRKALVALIVLAYLFAQYYTLSNQAYRALDLTSVPPLTSRALEAAEALVVAAAVIAFWGWSGVRRGLTWRPSALQVIAAALLVAVFLGARAGEDSSAAAILSLWTMGLTLFLPLPLYAIALALYGAALVACLARARREPAALRDAIALALLPVAGLTLDLTYQHLVAVVALLLLVLPPAAATEAERP